MRPSHYHYIKRIWVRSSYKKRQHKSIFTLPFRMIIFPYRVFFKSSAHFYKTGKKISNTLPKNNYAFIESDQLLNGFDKRHPKIIGRFFIIWGSITLMAGIATLFVSISHIFGIILILLALMIIFYGYGKTKYTNSSPSLITKPNTNNFSKNNNYKDFEKALSSSDIDRYAAMCNAYLEHQDEVEQYKDLT